MRRSQYDEIRRSLTKVFSYDDTRAVGIRLMVADGRHKGRAGTLIWDGGSRLVVEFDDKTHLTFPYSKLHRLDEAGEPILVPVTDMSGRVIEVGAVIVYSVSAGRASHAMEVARVIKLNDTGTLSVKPEIHNGARIEHRWKQIKTVSDPDRSLVMPVDLSLVTMWVLSSWDCFKADEI